MINEVVYLFYILLKIPTWDILYLILFVSLANKLFGHNETQSLSSLVDFFKSMIWYVLLKSRKDYFISFLSSCNLFYLSIQLTHMIIFFQIYLEWAFGYPLGFGLNSFEFQIFGVKNFSSVRVFINFSPSLVWVREQYMIKYLNLTEK